MCESSKLRLLERKKSLSWVKGHAIEVINGPYDLWMCVCVCLCVCVCVCVCVYVCVSVFVHLCGFFLVYV